MHGLVFAYACKKLFVFLGRRSLSLSFWVKFRIVSESDWQSHKTYNTWKRYASSIANLTFPDQTRAKIYFSHSLFLSLRRDHISPFQISELLLRIHIIIIDLQLFSFSFSSASVYTHVSLQVSVLVRFLV